MSVTNGNHIEFKCVKSGCTSIIPISVLDMQKNHKLRCSGCKNEYVFNDKLVEQIGKFERLVLAVQDAKEILGQTAVAVDMPGHSVKIPYKLLLTRLNTLLTLRINEEEIRLNFRVDPLEKQMLR